MCAPSLNQPYMSLIRGELEYRGGSWGTHEENRSLKDIWIPGCLLGQIRGIHGGVSRSLPLHLAALLHELPVVDALWS